MLTKVMDRQRALLLRQGPSMVVPRLLAGPRRVRLYRVGQITHGTLVEKRPTGTVVNGLPVMALTFRFEVSVPAALSSASGDGFALLEKGENKTAIIPGTIHDATFL